MEFYEVIDRRRTVREFQNRSVENEKIRRARAASITLTMEQVPSIRGTMMSMNTAAGSLGAALGSGIGGLALYLHGWRLVGISLGTLAILAMCIYQLLGRYINTY